MSTTPLQPTSSTADEPVFTGSCFCGSARYEVKGKPTMSAYCHCSLCQRFSGGAFVHTIHFPNAAFKWVTPSHSNFAWVHPSNNNENIVEEIHLEYTVPPKPWKTRYRCRKCGVQVASHNNKTNAWSVWGSQLERDPETNLIKYREPGSTTNDILKPTCHMFYGTRLLDVNDDLDKWEGYPGSARLS